MGAESQAGILHEDGAVDDTSRGATLLVADLAQFTLDLFVLTISKPLAPPTIATTSCSFPGFPS